MGYKSTSCSEVAEATGSVVPATAVTVWLAKVTAASASQSKFRGVTTGIVEAAVILALSSATWAFGNGVC